MSSSLEAEAIRMLKVRAGSMLKNAADVREMLIKKLSTPEAHSVSSFDAERFMQLPANEAVARRILKSIENFEAGQAHREDGVLITEQAELLTVMRQRFTSRLMLLVGRTAFSSSPAANQMEAYEASALRNVLELTEGL